MPPTLTYPGVYIQELPSDSRTITGVATAVAAFVGRSSRGPVDAPVPITSLAQYERVYGGLTRDGAMGYAVRDFYLNGGQQAVIVRLAPEAAAAQMTLEDDGGTAILTLRAVDPGTWGNVLEVDVQHASGTDGQLVAVEQGLGEDQADQLFHLTVREGDSENARLTETYPNVTFVEGPRRLDHVLAGSQLVDVVDDMAEEGRPPEGTSTVPTGTEGTDGVLLGSDDYTGGTLQADKRGLYALVHADLFTMLCLPPSAPEGSLPDDVWADALAFCVDERALLLVDPPEKAVLDGVSGAIDDVDAINRWLGPLGLTANGRNGALYFPRIRRPDPLRDGAIGAFVPSGAVAGIMARTDGARGVWKAPAGIEAGVVGASGLATPLTDGDSGRLNPLGINCLRTFPVIGSVVWGARTLRGADQLADQWKYVPVRRFTLFLEETLFRNTQWVVFEPNDETLWAQIRLSAGAFMQNLFRQGAFQGSTPRDAYFVKCDAETTTQFDIDSGVVNIVVGFAPLKPAEFVVVSIQQKTATTHA